MTGLAPHDLFAVELHHEAQHAVRRRVLRTHVDDHRVAELVLRPHAAGEHELARARAQLLRALVGLALEPRLFGGNAVERVIERGRFRSDPLDDRVARSGRPRSGR